MKKKLKKSAPVRDAIRTDSALAKRKKRKFQRFVPSKNCCFGDSNSIQITFKFLDRKLIPYCCCCFFGFGGFFGEDFSITGILLLFFLFFFSLERLSLKTKVSVLSNRIGIQYGRNVLQVDTHQLKE